MTELPEIEILRTEIGQHLSGLQIVKANCLKPCLPRQESELLVNRVLTGTYRRGKWLLLEFSEFVLLVHLKMVGQILLTPPFAGTPNDVHLMLSFANEAILTIGQMSFGEMKVLPSSEVASWEPLRKLGIDPLSEQFTVEHVASILETKQGAIKSLLLNQSLFPGIGNTYADEILFVAQIHPQTPGKMLSAGQIARLHTAILQEIKRGLELDGSSEMQFVHLDGRAGEYQKTFSVKRREGKPCRSCGTIVQRINVNAHGTYFCPHCQSQRQG